MTPAKAGLLFCSTLTRPTEPLTRKGPKKDGGQEQPTSGSHKEEAPRAEGEGKPTEPKDEAAKSQTNSDDAEPSKAADNDGNRVNRCLLRLAGMPGPVLRLDRPGPRHGDQVSDDRGPGRRRRHRLPPASESRDVATGGVYNYYNERNVRVTGQDDVTMHDLRRVVDKIRSEYWNPCVLEEHLYRHMHVCVPALKLNDDRTIFELEWLMGYGIPEVEHVWAQAKSFWDPAVAREGQERGSRQTLPCAIAFQVSLPWYIRSAPWSTKSDQRAQRLIPRRTHVHQRPCRRRPQHSESALRRQRPPHRSRAHDPPHGRPGARHERPRHPSRIRPRAGSPATTSTDWPLRPPRPTRPHSPPSGASASSGPTGRPTS